MADERRDWWRSQLSLGLVLHICIMMGGWVMFVATIKTTLTDHDRRILILEAEIVPRKEQESKERLEEQKEHLLDERLTNIERMLSRLTDRGERQ